MAKGQEPRRASGVCLQGIFLKSICRDHRVFFFWGGGGREGEAGLFGVWLHIPKTPRENPGQGKKTSLQSKVVHTSETTPS